MSKEIAVLTLLQSQPNCSWDTINACIVLNLFAHVNWSQHDLLLLRLMDKVHEQCSKNKKSASAFWNALRATDVTVHLTGNSNTPLWMRCLTSKRLHVFAAMVEANDISFADLQNLKNHAGFQISVLQAKNWSILSQIHSPDFASVKTWAEEYRKNNLWMLSETMPSLYKQRPDFLEHGIPLEEIKRWAQVWAQHDPTMVDHGVSPLLFATVKTNSKSERLVDRLNATDRKDIVEHLTLSNWKALANIPGMQTSDWLNQADPDVSLPALKTALSFWAATLNAPTLEQKNLQNFTRLFLKRSTRYWLMQNGDHQQKIFENFLSLWDGIEIQKEECVIVNRLMQTNSNLEKPWTWAVVNPLYIAVAVKAFLQSASDEEIEKNSRSICEFALKALEDPAVNEKLSHVLIQTAFYEIKNRPVSSSARPHLAQLLWINTFRSKPTTVAQRCNRWNALKKNEKHCENLRVFYPQIYPDLMDVCFQKLNLKKLTPEERSLVEKTCLEYNVSVVSSAAETKPARKM